MRPMAPDGSLTTRSTLLCRLRNLEDQESWRTFFDRYWELLYNVARRSGLGEPEAQDVVQETVIAVGQSDARFSLRPGAWLLQTVALAHCQPADHGCARSHNPPESLASGVGQNHTV